MATGEQLRAMLKTLEEGDEDRWYSIALQMAAHEARLGHGKLALELRELIDAIRAKHSVTSRQEAPVPLAQPRGELAGLLSATYPKTRLVDLTLDDDLQAKLRKVVHEQRQQVKLATHGLRARSKLLLVGPPGSGKTFTAKAMAGELHIPLFTIKLDGLITKFMGETAAKLRLVFDAMDRNRGVFLFDEFDAIAGRRAAVNDVGEIRRVLNSFLMFLEETQPTSVVIAATNHPELLDSAVFRRFDDVLQYRPPTLELAEAALRAHLQSLTTSDADWKKAARAALRLSYADIIKACQDAAKEVVLSNSHELTTAVLLQAIRERREAHHTAPKPPIRRRGK
jgi:SpoVK/Ycf46/Vps4 family AAA+-type ATPase